MTAHDATSAQNLSKIDHVIVLMMENRSFDHVLGYLKLDGVRPDVDGLEASMGNEDPSGKIPQGASTGAAEDQPEGARSWSRARRRTGADRR